ncbi:MAG: thrombospondin type 3 repeat-containing protein [Planctomycetes bacterium]|nr:thrombospondin type 3 repeat-containing protein [Planctomycetota bacterium]
MRISASWTALFVLSAPAFAQLQFKPVATINLDATANNANPQFIGSNPSAVAWENGDLIVAGFNSTGGTTNTGIVRVSNVLTTPSIGAAFGVTSTPSTRGYSGLATQGGQIAAAFDFGANSANGLALYNTSGGLVWQVNTFNASPNNAYRGFGGTDFDPGFVSGGGVDAGVSGLTTGSGRRALMNTATGLWTYTQSTGAIINVTPTATNWRDHAYDPATGDLYTRVNNDVSKHTRTGGNTFTPNVRIVDVTDASAVAGQNLEFLNTSLGNFVIYNDRPSTATQPLTTAVKIVDTSGVAQVYNLGPGFSAANSGGYYDFSWDAANARLALLDFGNRRVYVFELCSGVDGDGDGTQDCIDGCPSDPAKIAPGQCGCGVIDVDSDGDTVADCVDGCPSDPAKSAPGQCGCGVSDADSDGDLTADCNDGCPLDPAKVAPGICGCGVSDADSDGDSVVDCNDGCPNDPLKTAPGICGCGVSDADSDGDSVVDCNDGCPNDPLKTAPGICGCGVADSDSDGDTVADCNDGCPNDPLKIAAGVCGCGVADTDSDGDSVADCVDGCPTDPLKSAPGACGCGVADVDTDSDGILDCNDNCDTLANPLQEDCDSDNVGDVCEYASGTQTDFNLNSIPDNCEPGITVSYCTSGTSSIGCVATIGGSGVASASATAGYFVTTSGVEGQRQAITFYSLLGPKTPPTPFGAGFLCVKSPTQRTGNLQASGTPGLCNGLVSIDILDWAQTHPAGQGVPFTAGLTLNFQSSIRDPLSPGTRVMSNAIQVTLLP